MGYYLYVVTITFTLYGVFIYNNITKQKAFCFGEYFYGLVVPGTVFSRTPGGVSALDRSAVLFR